MTCKYCGTAIAANALICYRCGQSTAEPADAMRKTRRTPGSGGRSGWVSAIAAFILVVAALFMGQSTYAQVPRELSWVVGGLAVVVLAWSLWKRGWR